MSRVPQPGEIYQHFKGNLYRIITVAEHTETGEMMVVYQALYGEFQNYVRPLSMFVSEVDHQKYPEVTAKYRFTLIPAVGAAAPAFNGYGDAEASREPGQKMLKEQEHRSQKQPEAKKEQESNIRKEDEEREEPPKEEFELDPGLLAFLEADSYERKLEVFSTLYGKADESMLNTIAVSLDLELSGGSLEEQYETLKNCLLTLEKYECNRLR